MIGSARMALGDRVAASLAQTTIERRKAATLSSVERSALMDELVDQLIALKRSGAEQEKQLAGLETRTEFHAAGLRDYRAFRARGFWARWAWLWSGR